MAPAPAPAEKANSPGKSANTPLTVHVQFEVPKLTAASTSGSGENDTTPEETSTPSSVVITKQCFDASNCKITVVGLPEGVETVKPEPGDYSYSGMHDHGPLPPPKEGGNFAQIISLVSEAKKESDSYLTKVIEEEKAIIAASSAKTETDGEEGRQQKRKRK